MNLNNAMYCVSALGLVLAAACTGREPMPQEPGAPPAATPEVAKTSPASLLDMALGNVELGHDPVGTRTTLETLLTDGDLPPESRARAKLGLSRLASAAGDEAAAIRLVEEAAALDTRIEGVDDRLFELTTGRPAPKLPELADEPVVAPIARALSKGFEPGPDHKAAINLVLLGGGSAHVRLGTYAIGAALRQQADARCPSCDAQKLSIDEWATQFSGWTAMFRAAAKLPTSLVVFYLDHETMIPSRYDSYLPVPSAEIDGHLTKGEGFIAVKQRPGAPPVIVLAAPRRGQLERVEETFAKLKELPKSPLTVAIPPGLTPREIQGTVKGAFPRFKGCYDALLDRHKGAGGGVVSSFVVRGDGTVDKLRIEADHGLDDATFKGCIEGAWKGLTFARTGDPAGTTTVTYPLQLTPGDE